MNMRDWRVSEWSVYFNLRMGELRIQCVLVATVPREMCLREKCMRAGSRNLHFAWSLFLPPNFRLLWLFANFTARKVAARCIYISVG